MRRFLLSLIMLTQLNGSPVWVESKHVIVIRGHGPECSHGVGAVIVVGTRVLCVKEKADQIRAKIKAANGG